MSASETGLLFTTSRQFPSPQMLNKKTSVVGTGNQIQAILGSIEVGTIVSVVENSTDLALKAGFVYVKTAGGLVSLNYGVHTHKDSNDGGLFQDVWIKGSRTLWIKDYTDPTTFNYFTTLVGGTATQHASGWLFLNTGTTANNYINCFTRGLIYTFASPLMFQARLKLAMKTTNYVSRFGFNAETIETSSLDNDPKMVIEGCDSCSGTSVAFVTANGTNRFKDPTPITNTVTDTAAFICELSPTTAEAFYNRNNTTLITKTNVIPVSGIPTRSRQFLAGAQTTNTSFNGMDIHGFRAFGTIGESNWSI